MKGETWVRVGFASVVALSLLVLFFLTVPLGRQARLVPMYVVVPALMLAVIQVFREWRAPGPAAATRSKEPSATAREFRAVGWLLLLALSTAVFGFWMGAPLYVFLYLRFHGREPVRYALIVSLIVYGTLQAVFSLALDIPLHAGVFW